jgi:formylglycine-generating enzyme required for sulfatase activity
MSAPEAVTCPACRKEVPDGDWCEACGCSLKPQAEAQLLCQACGAENRESARFCRSCGKSLEPAAAAAAEVLLGADGAESVLIPAGEFMMGSDSGRPEEQPVHRVYVDAYYIDKHPVTFEQYDRFCEATVREKPNDQGWGRGRQPVINVTWDDAAAYAHWAGKRLPTEAEWERAAKGPKGLDQPGAVGEYAWHVENSGGRTHAVGEKKPNAYGLHDMLGNVWEWCADWYDEGYYSYLPVHNPRGPVAGTARVARGGGWFIFPRYARASGRFRSLPGSRDGGMGFRCVRAA